MQAKLTSGLPPDAQGLPKRNRLFTSRGTPEQWAVRADQPTYRWERLHGHFVLSQQDRARLAAKARILVEIVRSGEFPGCTVAELAEASGMSQSVGAKALEAVRNHVAEAVRRHGGKS